MYLPMTSGEISSPGGDLGSLGLEQNVSYIYNILTYEYKYVHTNI